MAPRAYNNETRQQQQAELKARIAAAAAELHAEQGALATSYAQIAERAGVSLPTVYKHFPGMDELMQACTGHVASSAPAFPQQALAQAADLASAARVLVDAADRGHAHFAPWRCWREQARLPVLAGMLESEQREVTAMCLQVLDRHLGAGDHRITAAVWASLLDFELWHQLVHQHKLSRAAARERLTPLLLAAAGPSPAAAPPRPTRKPQP